MNRLTAGLLAIAFVAASVLGAVSLAKATTNENTNNTNNTNSSKTVNLVCMQNAVVARDNAILTAESTLNVAWSNALTARRDALQAAWTLTTKKARMSAIHTAWTTYNKAMIAAKKAFRKSRNAAWATYRTTAKTCHGNLGEENHSASSDVLNSEK